MPAWLYDLPDWLFGLVIAATWTVLGIGGHMLFQRFVRKPFQEADKQLSIALLAVVATINSLLLAFCAVSSWESYRGAEDAVNAEANTVGELAQDLAVYNTPESREARELLRTYARAVIHEEWQTMRIGQESLDARRLFDAAFRAVGRITTEGSTQSALMPEIWARANELIKFRRLRIDASQSNVPGILWIVVAIGTLLTVVPTYALPGTRFNRGAVGLLSVSMGLVFFLVAVLDRPFLGAEGMTAEAFETSLESMARWDAESAGAQGRDLSERLR